MYPQLIQQFLTAERLPDTYGDDAIQWLLPYLDTLKSEIGGFGKPPLLLGINGAQGTGKSTLSRLIGTAMQASGMRALCLSMDDFYLPKAERMRLARTVHPLLKTRGVPGTHDVALLQNTLTRLQHATGNDEILLPKFDKAADDRVATAQFRRHRGSVDLLVLEGWFVGVRAQSAKDLAIPVNELEQWEDPVGTWRHFVNERLRRDYEPLFRRLHRLLVLQAPGFGPVYQWRGLQEEKLRQASSAGTAGLMDDRQLKHFIQHYERLTRHGLACLPALADTVFELSPAHRVTARRDRKRPNRG